MNCSNDSGAAGSYRKAEQLSQHKTCLHSSPLALLVHGVGSLRAGLFAFGAYLVLCVIVFANGALRGRLGGNQSELIQMAARRKSLVRVLLQIFTLWVTA